MKTENTGQRLNKEWNIGAKHALYSKDGTWYEKLKRFPGALLDADGYILFQTELDFLNCPHLNIKKKVTVSTPGISQIKGYIQVNEDTIRKTLSGIEELEENKDFDPKNVEDARERIARSIAYRRGQPKFRKLLLKEFEEKCAITGCNVKETLEAAHIIPYKGEQTNVLENGLLLRADIHTLFDLGLITVNPGDMTILISPELKGTLYMEFNSKNLFIKENLSEKIKEALEVHFQSHH
jgi:hypothetical protein